MGDEAALLAKASRIGERLVEAVRAKRKPIIVGHLDADGIASSTLVARALDRIGGRFLVRIVGDLTPSLLDELSTEGHDFYVFCDLGAGLLKGMRERFGDRWAAIDHHKPPKDELGAEGVFNPWAFGFDGGREVCTTTLSYLVASRIGQENVDLSWLPVVGAVADRQDQGENHSIFSLNRRALEDAKREGYVDATLDLVLYGRETRPIHEAIAYTSMPFIPGLTGNRDTCLAALHATGLRLQENDRWRTISELSEEEKRLVLEAIVPYLAPHPNRDSIVKELLGEVYTLLHEDEQTPLRDAREFGTLLNACGRMRKAGIGVAICLGDRGEALRDGEKVLADYRQMINRAVMSIAGDEARILERHQYALLSGEGVIAEDLLGAVASVLSLVPRFSGRLLVVKTNTESGEIKFSARKPRNVNGGVDLGSALRDAAVACEGVGGGHEMAAGARVPARRLQEFLARLDSALG